MKRIVLQMTVLVLGLNLSEVKAHTDVSTPSMPTKSIGEALADIKTVSPEFNSSDVTNAADVADVADKILTGVELDVLTEIKRCFSAPITKSSLSAVMTALQSATNTLTEAHLSMRLAISYGQIERVEKKMLQYQSGQQEIASNLHLKSWKQEVERVWKLNQIMQWQLTQMIGFVNDTSELLRDIGPISPPKELSATIIKAYGTHFPDWEKRLHLL